MCSRPGLIHVAALDEFPLIVAGLQALIGYEGSGICVEAVDGSSLVGYDVALYDVEVNRRRAGSDFHDIRRGSQVRMVIFTEDISPDVQARWVARGAWAAVVRDVHRAVARPVTPPPAEPRHGADWTGRSHGLRRSESAVMELLVQGLSLPEVAAEMYLSVNTVKTYVRTTYRTIGVSRRADAVRWGIVHGFAPRAPTAPAVDDEQRQLDARRNPQA